MLAGGVGSPRGGGLLPQAEVPSRAARRVAAMLHNGSKRLVLCGLPGQLTKCRRMPPPTLSVVAADREHSMRTRRSRIPTRRRRDFATILSRKRSVSAVTADATTTRTVREVTLDLLRDLGMTTIFSNPSHTEMKLFEAWPDDFKFVMGLQEASVVSMADGHAQATGEP